MSAAGWFALGAFTAGPLVGVVLWLLLAPEVRRRAYAVCQERSRIEYGSRPACADGFNANPPAQRRRAPDHQMVARPAADPTPRIVEHL